MKKILIIKHGALGDVVLSMYPIFTIWNHFKDYEISILTEEKYTELYKCLPFIENIVIDNRPKIYHFLNYIRIVWWFKKSNFEWVFDLQTSKRTNLYFFLFSLFKNFYWSGIAKNCSHPHNSNNRTKLHTIERQKEQLKYAGINNYFSPKWNLLINNTNKLKLKKPYAIIVPGGSKHRKNKRWDFKNFLQIIEYLKKHSIISVLIGGKDEKHIFDNYKSNKFIMNLIGKTSYSDLAYISSGANLILGNDTGPMHLLIACSKKETVKIVLFGEGSDPDLCAPRGKKVFIIQEKNINQIIPKRVIKVINENNYSKLQKF